MNRKGNILGAILLGAMILCLLYVFTDFTWGIGCHVKPIFDKDLYCNKEYTSNWSNSMGEYKIRSHSVDKANDEERARQYALQLKAEEEARACYANGTNYNASFEIGKNYDFNCKQVAYINDHLVDETQKLQSGYIAGHHLGLFSGGRIEGEFYQYVTERILATGQLVQNISYHEDCNKVKSNEQINYYTESEFVMYYVKTCIK